MQADKKHAVIMTWYKDTSLQGGPAKVKPTYIISGNIWMHR